jgi:hypothetical protein
MKHLFLLSFFFMLFLKDARTQFPVNWDVISEESVRDEKGREGTKLCAIRTLDSGRIKIEDTVCCITYKASILEIADSIALHFGVPPQLVYEIGMNESRWPNIHDMDYLIKDGDLQVIDRSFWILYKELNLTGGKTRYNYLLCAIYYLRKNYDKYGSWEKARYAYGRGRWKPPEQWTAMERNFMRKIDWSKYDQNK